MGNLIINSELYQWARDRVGLSNDELAKSVGIKPEKIANWEQGKDHPTYLQLQKLANTLRIPAGYLFLSNPPSLEKPVTDFRSSDEFDKNHFSINLQDVIDDALRKRDWYRNWRIDQGFEEYEYVGKFSIDDNERLVVSDIREKLKIREDFALKLHSWEEHFRELVRITESAGIIVLQNGVVGNNTHRKLSPNEFRGFALSDNFAPIIFINSRDYIAPRIFTLAHELAHIWIGTSGISNPEVDIKNNQENDIEKFCNKIAASLLVPDNMFFDYWNKGNDLVDKVQELAKTFRVSSLVILRKSLDSELITKTEFYETYEQLSREVTPLKKGKGGDFYLTLEKRNSKKFTETLITSLFSGYESYITAARLLNIKPSSIGKVLEEFG